LELSRIDGIDLVQMLASECPNTRTLVLTSNPDWRVRPALIAGAAGVLLKDTTPDAIRAAIHSIHLGDQVLCREAARWVLDQNPSGTLTPRESAVLRMAAQGASNAEIAEELHLGQKTVRNYVSRLYRKLDLHNRAQIATYLARTEGAFVASRTISRPAEIESSANNK
jgi:DNA-binding NarL/FixJ family response regulator